MSADKPADKPVLDNIRIVLVEPQGSLNVGATCRAMKNFGLRHLAVVRPGCELDLDALKMAMRAKDILQSAYITDDIGVTTRDSVLVLGTANRRGEYHEPYCPLREAMPRIERALPHGPVTILFGREEWGLTKEDLQFCQGVIHIETHPDFSSLNLAQAVLLVAHELYQNFGAHVPLPKARCDDPFEQPPTAEELQRLYQHMQAVLSMCEFLPLVNGDDLLQVIKAFMARSEPTRREVNILMGMFSNLRGFMQKYVR